MKTNRNIPWRRLADLMAVTVIVITAALTVQTVWSRPRVLPPTRLANGITYEGLQDSVGFVDLVTVDLRSPNIAVEVGPVVPTIEDHRLFWLPNQMQSERWAVAVSGGDFTTAWGRYAPAGDRGQPTHALIANGRTLQRQSSGMLLWFDEYQTGHIEPATENSAAWTAARWCVGTRSGLVSQGRVMDPSSTTKKRRTCVGLDQAGCRLHMATFTSATETEAATFLSSHGAWNAMELTTAENAGLVLNANLVKNWSGIPRGPQRFLTHALVVKTRETVPSHR
ncbi:MAG TPA: phosphodiester glycosidase family protein [Planctomycetaceae bacterium]|jgi:hypothetical protein|nr:phosphodiester glycosidase family protein [Planctomycetaceae bacterium]